MYALKYFFHYLIRYRFPNYATCLLLTTSSVSCNLLPLSCWNMYVSFANKQNQLNFNYIENNISSSIIHFYGIKFRKGNVNNSVNINVFLYNMIMLRTKCF